MRPIGIALRSAFRVKTDMRLPVLVLAPFLILGACTTHRGVRPAIAAEDLATLLRQPPSKTEMVAMHFTVSGSRGQKMNGPRELPNSSVEI